MRMMAAALLLTLAPCLPASAVIASAPRATAQDAIAPVRGWPLVDGPGRVFSVEMPAAPIYQQRGANHIYLAAFEGSEFTAQTQTFPADAVANPRANLERGVAGTAMSLPSGAWETVTWSIFQDAQAVDVTGFTASGLHARMFMILKGRQYYVFAYSGPRGTVRSADAERFFNSVRLRP
jgi:hypothetical protein